MYIPKVTFAKLLHAKMFLGGARRMWNPEIVGYLSGTRNRTSILDLTQTSFRLKKFLGFVELTSLRRGRTMIILRPAFAPLAELIYPLADYFPRYMGGALSNLTFTCYHAKVKHKYTFDGYTRVRYPSIAVLFGDQSRHVDFMVNETVCTRTPSALLCDATTFASAIPYHIPTSSDFASARLMTHHVLTAIRRGQRHEKLSLRRVFRSLVRSAVKKYLKIHTNVYPHAVTKALRSSAYFGTDTLHRLSLLKFYFGHKLHFLRPKTFKDEKYAAKIKRLLLDRRFSNVKNTAKPISIIRKGIALISALACVLKFNCYIPIFGPKADELIFAGPRKDERRELKRLNKREQKNLRKIKHYAHKDITRHPNIIKNPFRKRKAKNKEHTTIFLSKYIINKKKKRGRGIKGIAGSHPETIIRIMNEKIKNINSADTLKSIWLQFEKYPKLRKRLFKGRIHNLVHQKVVDKTTS
jgi:hypothetical protein